MSFPSQLLKVAFESPNATCFAEYKTVGHYAVNDDCTGGLNFANMSPNRLKLTRLPTPGLLGKKAIFTRQQLAK